MFHKLTNQHILHLVIVVLISLVFECVIASFDSIDPFTIPVRDQQSMPVRTRENNQNTQEKARNY